MWDSRRNNKIEFQRKHTAPFYLQTNQTKYIWIHLETRGTLDSCDKWWVFIGGFFQVSGQIIWAQLQIFFQTIFKYTPYAGQAGGQSASQSVLDCAACKKKKEMPSWCGDAEKMNEWMKDLCRGKPVLYKTQWWRDRQEARLYGKVISQIFEGLCWWQKKKVVLSTAASQTHTCVPTTHSSYLSDSTVLSLSDYLFQRAENERTEVHVCVLSCLCVCV